MPEEELQGSQTSSEKLSDADLQKMVEKAEKETAVRVAQMIINYDPAEQDPLGR